MIYIYIYIHIFIYIDTICMCEKKHIYIYHVYSILYIHGWQREPTDGLIGA